MNNWETYQHSVIRYPDLGFSLDFSRMDAPDVDSPAEWPPGMEQKIHRAYRDRKAIEAGEIMNPDEGRAVGHYWLRNPDLAPREEGQWIRDVRGQVESFAGKVLRGEIVAPNERAFRHILLIGIGGSALGPQLVAKALLPPNPPIDIQFFDNTDPGGMDDVFAALGDGLAETLVIVISKSGGTAETRNGMLETEARYENLGLDFAKHAVAVTGDGSKLDDYAKSKGWIARLPMADWIGGRTSIMSAVGLLPAALLGLNIGDFLDGAAAMDEKTRSEKTSENASMALALMWYHAGDGRGKKDMVILPYCDRLELMSKYLQQLVMESIGKEHDLDGKVVHQGLAVYGNKGSTDQHAYVQQLRDGLANFFATFIEVRQTRDSASFAVDDKGSTTGDYLQGFLRGTRDALYESGRQSTTVSLDRLDARSVGMLIALYERAVSFYASLVNINAYHQPGVEAGKKASGAFLDLLYRVKRHLAESESGGATADAVASNLGESDVEAVYHCLNRLAATGFCERIQGPGPAQDEFRY
ncbi:MAG: glucose-6-phosphate isomerase [Verrucomicrobiales bacterium]